jgi:two-component system sensor histidine kinase KdpD
VSAFGAVPIAALRRPLIATGTSAVALAITTAIVAFLEGDAPGIADASPLYLIAVVVLGAAFGTGPAVATALAAFVVYDVLFTEPHLSLLVADPREWLDLLLFLFVALAVGRLVAVEHRRADEADRRTREANSLFALSRLLATADATEDAAPDIARRLTTDARLSRVTIAVGPAGRERVVADTATDAGPLPPAAITASLVRRPGDEPARWVRTHAPRAKHEIATRTVGPQPDSAEALQDHERLRVRIESDDVILGSLVAVRQRSLGLPTREETRIMALAADQIALSLRRDQAHRGATDLEIARQGDALKTALIDSVSHDLRTPLASIRATAGGLADPAVDWTDETRRAAAALIDTEATRLDRLVGGMLDLGRIDSGSLRPELEPHDLASLVVPVLERSRSQLGAREVHVDIAPDIPPVEVDALLLDAILSNLLENAATYAPAPAIVRVRAESTPSDRPHTVRLIVEDGGPGVPEAERSRIFGRFHRVPGSGQGARRGMGIGLSVVKGLTEAMGGSIEAAASPLGGLAVEIHLRAIADAPEPEA